MEKENTVLGHTIPSRKRPIVIIGAGGIVNDAHLPAYGKAGFKAVSIVDLNLEKAKEIAQRFSIPNVYDDIKKCIAEAPENAVYDVALPASALKNVLPLIPKKSGVLIQKPFGSDHSDAKSLLEICKSNELIAAVNFQMRTLSLIKKAKEIIAEGLIGEIHDIDTRITVNTPWELWDFLKTAPRLEILYHSIHYIDCIRSFWGDPMGVYGKTVVHPKTADFAPTRSTIILDYDGMRRATVTTNHGHIYGDAYEESNFKIEGSKGAIRIVMGLNLNYPEGKADRFELCRVDENGKSLGWKDVAVEGTWFPDAFIGTMANLQCHLEDASIPLAASVADAERTMACVEAAYTSSAQGGVPLPE